MSNRNLGSANGFGACAEAESAELDYAEGRQ